MYDPTFMQRATATVHEDRVRALQQSRRGRSYPQRSVIRGALALYGRLTRNLKTAQAPVAPHSQLPS